MKSSLPSARPTAATCLDCPLQRKSMLRELVGSAGKSSCKLVCASVEERSAVPPEWFQRHAFAVVRRGMLIRERLDPSGVPTAIDVAGPGALVPLTTARGGSAYAASRVLLCVYPEPRLGDTKAGADGALDLLSLAEETLERVERIAEARRRSTASARVDALKAVLTECYGPQCIDALLQRDLAALLGMRAETVCRVIKSQSVIEACRPLRQVN